MSALDYTWLAYTLNYLFMTLVGVWVTYFLMGRVFQRRHAPYLWWLYFAAKGFVYGFLLSGAELEGAAPYQDLIALESSVTSILSLLVILYTWRGDYVEVALTAVVSDTLAATSAVLCRMLANVLMGYAPDRGWLYAPDLSTVLDVMLRVLTTMILQRYIVGLLHNVRRMSMRHHLAASCAVAAYLAFFAAELTISSRYERVGGHLSYLEWILLPTMLGAALLVARRARDMSRREEALASCLRLARDYDRVVRAQLAEFNAGRFALEGHERSLARLREGTSDHDVVERIRELERTYRRLSAGNFCDQPALDAVLTAGVRRLREAGVRCEVTVAGLPSASVEPACAALAMLNVASEAAERQRGRGGGRDRGARPGENDEGQVMELRVRGLGDRTPLHLDVPASWGRLGARRALSVLCREGEELVSERRRGSRTVVLMVTTEEDR